MTDYLTNDVDLKKVADAIRAKGGTTAPLVFPDGFSAAVGAISTAPDTQEKAVTITENGVLAVTPDEGKVLSKVDVTVNVDGSGGGGGGTVTVNGPAITFVDYDGTVVKKWAVADLADKTALPLPPTHDGLTFQGWNWTLEDIKALTQEMIVGPMYITDDGKTRLYIHLEEGRTSPMLGCCPNGTVTVDWGDGTEPDTLTGFSTTTVKWTPAHAYTAAGDYVATLQVDGTVGITGNVNNGSYLLRYASGADNRSGVYLNALRQVKIGAGVTSIGGSAFSSCYSLASITIPSGVTRIGGYAFSHCYSLSSITIPSGVTSIDGSAFFNCYSLASITIPSGVTNIRSGAFSYCYGVKYYDFTALTVVPNLVNTSAFTGIAADCEIRVPASLIDEWKAAENWSTYADYIVGV